MTSPYGPMRLIANPAAGRGRDPVLPRLTRVLEDRGLEHEVVMTRSQGHATTLAREAIERDGRRYLVAVGGDGTVHEVVNGMIDPETGASADGLVLGTVPAGSGADFVRTFGLSLPPERFVKHLEGESVYPIDVGRIRLVGLDGSERTVLFVNIAEVGYGAVVVSRAERFPRALGRLRYLVAVFVAIRTFGRKAATITLDHTEQSGEYSNVVVANCQFFGGAMHVAPLATPDDGQFDVQLWRGSVKDVFLMTNQIRRGEHTGHPEIQTYRSAGLEVTTDENILVEADGEVLGHAPARFDILPRALSLKI